MKSNLEKFYLLLIKHRKKLRLAVLAIFFAVLFVNYFSSYDYLVESEKTEAITDSIFLCGKDRMDTTLLKAAPIPIVKKETKNPQKQNVKTPQTEQVEYSNAELFSIMLHTTIWPRLSLLLIALYIFYVVFDVVQRKKGLRVYEEYNNILRYVLYGVSCIVIIIGLLIGENCQRGADDVLYFFRLLGLLGFVYIAAYLLLSFLPYKIQKRGGAVYTKEEDNAPFETLLNELYGNMWFIDGRYIPMSHACSNYARECFAKMSFLSPSDETLIEKYNQLVYDYNESQERKLNIDKVSGIVMGIIVASLFLSSFTEGSVFYVLIALLLGIGYCACISRPNFVSRTIDNEKWQSTEGLIKRLLIITGVVSLIPTTETVTVYSDGRTESSNPGALIKLAVILMILNIVMSISLVYMFVELHYNNKKYPVNAETLLNRNIRTIKGKEVKESFVKLKGIDWDKYLTKTWLVLLAGFVPFVNIAWLGIYMLNLFRCRYYNVLITDSGIYMVDTVRPSYTRKKDYCSFYKINDITEAVVLDVQDDGKGSVVVHRKGFRRKLKFANIDNSVFVGNTLNEIIVTIKN